MPIITLITDFGAKDMYAGVLKGNILKHCDSARIIDLSHHIAPFDIIQAAYCLKNSYHHFPKTTIHVVAVNDDLSPENRLLGMLYKGHYFIGYDNGLFQMAFGEDPILAVELSKGQEDKKAVYSNFNETISHTIASLNDGKTLTDLGRQVHHIRQRTAIQPTIQDAHLRGTVIYLDAFENAVTNIKRELFDQTRKDRRFVLYFKRNERLSEISNSYYDAPEGEKLCTFNAAGNLEIAINKGKAGSLLGLKVGDTVQIDFE